MMRCDGGDAWGILLRFAKTKTISRVVDLDNSTGCNENLKKKKLKSACSETDFSTALSRKCNQRVA